MKFSYHWIRELVPGLDTEPAELMRLITMKTAECEGLEQVGAALADASVARVKEVELIAGSHNQIVVVRNGALRHQARGLRRAELQAGNVDRVSAARAEGDRRRGERRDAGERAGTGHRRDHTGIVELDSEALLERRTPSSKSTTNRSRIGRICGAITEWRAKWRRSRTGRCAIR